MKLSQLLERMEYTCVQGSADIPVSHLLYDSRNACPDGVFVCISGAVMDGHTFISDVVMKGVTAVIVEKEVKAPAHVTVIRVENTRVALAYMSAAYFGYPAEQLKTIGITGTKGKTTTTYMVRSWKTPVLKPVLSAPSKPSSAKKSSKPIIRPRNPILSSSISATWSMQAATVLLWKYLPRD